MNTRLKQFLSAENITQSQFADTINVVRASVSHVLSGRNNPSYDFIKAIMSSYPQLNIEWLIFGKGKMYKDTLPPAWENRQDEYYHEENLLFGEETAENEPEQIKAEPAEEMSNPLPTVPAQQISSIQTKRKVRKVIILYDDDSYQEI